MFAPGTKTRGPAWGRGSALGDGKSVVIYQTKGRPGVFPAGRPAAAFVVEHETLLLAVGGSPPAVRALGTLMVKR